MNRIFMAVLVAVAVMLAACETQEKTGALTGGAAGAIVGQELGGTTGTLLGAVGGALLGREIGQRLDERDKRQIATALESNETGETDVWTNPDTGEQYTVTPTDTFEEDGQPCRRFEMDVEGVEEDVSGVACRTAAGDWQIVG